MSVLDDLVQPFQVGSQSAQGRLVKIGPSLDAVLSAHNYPSIVSGLLGELIVVGAMLSGIQKNSGVLSIQINGSAAIKFIVVDVTHDGGIRGYARFDEIKINSLGSDSYVAGKAKVPLLLPNGKLTFTLTEEGKKTPYQGVVPLEGKTIGECIAAYFRKSVQSEAVFKIGVAHCEFGWRAGGLMLQRLAQSGFQPQSGDARIIDLDEIWYRAVVLMRSCSITELTSKTLHPHELLYRLFNEDGVRVFRSEALHMKCRCSQEKVKNVLSKFSQSEVQKMQNENHVIVTCEFCNCEYKFLINDIIKVDNNTQ